MNAIYRCLVLKVCDLATPGGSPSVGGKAWEQALSDISSTSKISASKLEQLLAAYDTAKGQDEILYAIQTAGTTVENFKKLIALAIVNGCTTDKTAQLAPPTTQPAGTEYGPAAPITNTTAGGTVGAQFIPTAEDVAKLLKSAQSRALVGQQAASSSFRWASGAAVAQATGPAPGAPITGGAPAGKMNTTVLLGAAALAALFLLKR